MLKERLIYHKDLSLKYFVRKNVINHLHDTTTKKVHSVDLNRCYYKLNRFTYLSKHHYKPLGLCATLYLLLGD